jgi:outer membrane biosynthesis protein TonB
MEFIRQLVAFIILVDPRDELASRSPEQIADHWIKVANCLTESQLVELMDAGQIELFHLWIDTWYKEQPAAPQEPEPEPEPEEIEEELEPKLEEVEAEIAQEQVVEEEPPQEEPEPAPDVKNNGSKAKRRKKRGQ